MTAVHRVAVLVFDGVKLLDVAGPSEVFAEANRGGANYELVICSVGGHDVDSSTGMRIPVDCDVADSGSFDTLLVMGGDVFPSMPVSPELRERAIWRDVRVGLPRSVPGHSSWRRVDCSTDAAQRRIGNTRQRWRAPIRRSR